ncbi:MAG: bifunctional 4-hydroxy-2-oxoglutarate aldolase/2-dehydro-3-deoxy-phosphogluconate aldolase [Acidobacteria bacterium]|nr:bifunctional 4-hydroxy-2-oxoglutarate aldolase/2-dehydro-3-deoxy-phosphogluconate aldolase [Acidobacteriota bacterium]
MTINEVIRRIEQVGVIPVVRAGSVDEARRAVEAIYAGGIPIVEITMTVPDAPEVVRQVVREYGNDLLAGAGTVLQSTAAKRCLDAGAEFLVSPGLSISVLSTAAATDKLAIPGSLTPTELMTALDSDARLVKIFPCGNLGGPKYLKSLKAPFPDARLIPTGGVNAANAAEYFAAGAFALGIGADLVDLAALRDGNLNKISRAARELAAAVQAARPPAALPSSR